MSKKNRIKEDFWAALFLYGMAVATIILFAIFVWSLIKIIIAG
tara:strand:- start:630 stop:758 length:129 start_codon:yes stop_codon:yes gene_type:complete